jgi:hypothetical protein
MFGRNKKSYKNLYLHILEIGVENVNEGLKYNELKQKLEKMGYVFNTKCLEQVVGEWFSNSFTQCELGEDNIEESSDDNFILKGEASITYLNYINAQKSKKYCFWAIVLSTLAIFITILLTLFQMEIIG